MKSRKIYRQTAGDFFNYDGQVLNKNRKISAIINNPKLLLYACVGVLLLLAVVLSFSITDSLFGPSQKDSVIGDFFVDSYGILSFIIPAYLLYAAFILIDKSYRPSYIFVLYCAIFPFMTLAIGFSFLRDYNYFAGSIQFFSVLGKSGFSFIIVCLTVLESAVITALSNILFPSPPVRRPRVAGAPHPGRSASFKAEIKLLREPSVYGAAEKESLDIVHEAYTKAFEELQDLENVTNNAVDAAFENLEPNLEILNAKLKNLGAGMDDIDAKLVRLDTDLDTLKSELSFTENDGNGDAVFSDNFEMLELPEEYGTVEALEPLEEDGAVETPEPLEEYDDVEMLDPLEEDGAIEELYEAEELNGEEDSGVVDFEKIIDRTEAEAAIKTEEVIKKKNCCAVNQSRPACFNGKYSVPVDGVLKEYADDKYWVIDGPTYEAAAILKETLNEFNIQAEVTGIRKGPVITMFEILPSPGVKLSKIVNLQDNIALRLAAASVRIVAPIPGKHAVGIEIPNKKRNIVSFREIIETELARSGKKPEIPVVLGKDITGESVTVDLATMPHLLIAGATGSGKSVCVNTMILSILYQCRPTQCRLILIDPKIVELKLYNDIPHLLTPVITEPKRAFQALQYCIYEMERRYACLDSMGVRDIKTYNKRIKEKKIATEHIPYIVIVIDEFADLMATTGKELESTVARLAAMSRAVGIHLVLATQRPSIDVITGLIKSNIPTRIAFMVASMMDSRIIIDTPGAEKLLGKGDMLYSGIVDPFPVRMQGAFVSEEEVEAVVAHVKTLGEPDYIDEEIFFDDDEDATRNVYEEGDDPLYDKALEIVIQQGKASASYIQRRLKIGYNRAARLVEEMEQRGVVGPAQGSKPRELLRA
jgi:S-DNA-T family DNA segregation ATPase FtsK/SpoIIIE